jgi:ABC-type multidrug transport system permease subunit
LGPWFADLMLRLKELEAWTSDFNVRMYVIFFVYLFVGIVITSAAACVVVVVVVVMMAAAAGAAT